MAAVTIHSDFGVQENKVCHCFHTHKKTKSHHSKSRMEINASLCEGIIELSITEFLSSQEELETNLSATSLPPFVTR